MNLRKTVPMLTLLAAIAAWPLGAPAPATAGLSGTTSAPPEITAAYQQMGSAMEHLDATGVLKIFAANVVFIDSSGHKIYLAAADKMTRSMFPALQSVAADLTIQNVVVQKDGVTVILKQKVTSTSTNPKTGVLDTTVETTVERDHWVQVGGQWKINRVRLLSAYVQTNGKTAPFAE